VLGEGPAARAEDIRRAMDLVRQGVLLWLALLIIGGWLLA
jgi:adenosylcobinamide-phosphate synthase